MHESLDHEIQTLQSIFWSERDPDGLAFASLADAFRRKGEVREALDLLTDGMSRHPDFVTGHAVVTRLYRDQGMDFEAELAARRVLELDPENLVGLSVLTGVLADKGEADEASRHRTMLLSVDPESEEARAVAALAIEGEAVPSADPAEITELVPEAMHRSGTPDSLLDDLTLEESGEGVVDPDVAEEELSLAMDALGLVGEDEVPTAGEADGADLDAVLPGPEMEFEGLDALGTADAHVLDLRALAPDEPAEPEGVVMDIGDLGTSAPDEPSEPQEAVMDLGALAPDEAAEPEEVVMDLGALAPDEAADTEDVIMDLGALAPDEPTEPEGPIMDLGALAPDEPADDVIDLGALAPDEPDEVVMDLGALAPDEPDEIVMDLDALAPDEPAEPVGVVMDLGALAPDEPDEPEEVVMDLGALAPDELGEPDEEDVADPAETEAPNMNDKQSEPIFTRTLADLYIKQGFDDKALEVLKALQARHPDDADLAERIATLEGGGTPDASLPEVTMEGNEHAEDDVETRARELAERGQDGEAEVDTPFAWNSAADAGDDGDSGDEPPAGSYFDQLLAWENRAES